MLLSVWLASPPCVQAVVDGGGIRPLDDMLIPRTRRHSDDGDFGLASTSSSTGAIAITSHNGNGGGGSSWFSWFGKGDRYERAQDDSGLPPPRMQVRLGGGACHVM